MDDTASAIFRLNSKALAAKRIVATFDAEEQQVFDPQALAKLIQLHRDEWGILSTVTTRSLIEVLEDQFHLKEVVLKGPTHQQKFVRYIWRKAPLLEVAASLRSTAYLCHSSAVVLHGLAETRPGVFYVNYEQTEKPRSSGELTQEGIDRAFRGKQRQSTFAFKHGSSEIVMLSGKHTNGLEVQSLPLSNGSKVRVTGIERTLIDITVRPAYAGGVREVLEVYRRAKNKVSVPKLITTLKNLDYVYPYHQAIGFYMGRAGYPANLCSALNLGMDLNFYLAHNLGDMELDEAWRLYHPKGM